MMPNKFQKKIFLKKIVNFKSNNLVTHTEGRDNYICYNRTAEGQRRRKTLKEAKAKQTHYIKRNKDSKATRLCIRKAGTKPNKDRFAAYVKQNLTVSSLLCP